MSFNLIASLFIAVFSAGIDIAAIIRIIRHPQAIYTNPTLKKDAVSNLVVAGMIGFLIMGNPAIVESGLFLNLHIEIVLLIGSLVLTVWANSILYDTFHPVGQKPVVLVSAIPFFGIDRNSEKIILPDFNPKTETFSYINPKIDELNLYLNQIPQTVHQVSCDLSKLNLPLPKPGAATVIHVDELPSIS